MRRLCGARSHSASRTTGQRSEPSLLFTAYHLHVPWAMPMVLLDLFLYVYPSKRYRSALMGIAVHSVETVAFTILVLAVVLG